MKTIYRPAGFSLSSLIACAAMAIIMASTATAASPNATKSFSSALISAAELRTLLASSSKSSPEQAIRVLDTRELLQADNKTPNFEAGHIQGLCHCPTPCFAAPKRTPAAAQALRSSLACFNR